MTHFELPREERFKHRITDGLVRLSIGVEDVRDLNSGLDKAVQVARRKK
ncbi:PLP-dependent transferase [Alloscardovia macacae]|uniref:Cystathionine beta-lyase n=1 Tax=Alloscardovia macacae TaxID=1160091 RepID=A0A261F3W3_9BIFI|nr:PLP-dependent transferase [Alloscardovia macacae]OZG53810.1 cystathionine beta-lyase [Alloscardovia macacae]